MKAATGKTYPNSSKCFNDVFLFTLATISVRFISSFTTYACEHYSSRDSSTAP